MRTTIALLGLGLLGVTVTFGACLVVLKHDVGQLQAHHGAQNPGTSQTVTCGQLQHLVLRVGARNRAHVGLQQSTSTFGCLRVHTSSEGSHRWSRGYAYLHSLRRVYLRDASGCTRRAGTAISCGRT